jgi:hypothetical protein
MTFSEDNRIVTVTGIAADVIAFIHHDEFDSQNVDASLVLLERAVAFATQMLIENPIQRFSALFNFWRVLVADRTRTGETPAPAYWEHALKVIHKEDEIPEDFQPELIDEKPVDRFANYIMPLQEQLIHILLGRRFFVTKGGLLGIGPHTVKEGDEVSVVFGADMPMIFRQANEHKVLIGDCYVHGIMQGEIIEAHNKEGSQMLTTEFTIK